MNFGRRLYGRYSDWSLRAPYVCAFCTCLFKGSLADVTAQKMVERKKTINWQRTAAFGMFSGMYLGCGQHVWYNIWFPRILGKSNTMKGAVKYVVADGTVHTPMCYLPLYYGFENWALGGMNVEAWKSGTRAYFGPDGWKTLTTYWSLWPLFHFVNFRFTPVHFRIASIACASYLWLIILSFLTHEELDDRGSEEEPDSSSRRELDGVRS